MLGTGLHAWHWLQRQGEPLVERGVAVCEGFTSAVGAWPTAVVCAGVGGVDVEPGFDVGGIHGSPPNGSRQSPPLRWPVGWRW